MEYALEKIKNELSEFIGNDVLDRLSTPPPHIEADLALPLESPDKAEELKENMDDGDFEFIESFSTANNFLNISLNRDKVYHYVLSQILDLGFGYGASDKNSGKKAFIEYSSPNIAKPMGVGHLRSTIMGEALARIYESTGFEVWRENYPGDWGLPFGKVMVAMEKWGDENVLEENSLENLKELYVRFQKEAKENEALNDQAKEVFNRLEKGDEEVVEMWKKIRNLSLKEFMKVYSNLRIEFDRYGGESEVAEKAKEEIDNCLDKGICFKTEEGSIAAEVDDLPSFLMQKEDGSTLYMTRDLRTLKERIKKHNPDQILYVVGDEQKLYFQQLFALADKMDYLGDTTPKHIYFGQITVDGRPMSTREGTLIELDDLLKKAKKKAKSLVNKKNPDLDEETKKEVSREVGIGSVFYNDLSQSRNKTISFDWDKMLDLSSGSGPYLQYTHARIKSVLRNLIGEEEGFNDILSQESKDFTFTFEEKIEFEVAENIMHFPEILLKTADNDSPLTLCNYLEDLASSFNSFYGNISVKETEEEDLKVSRLVLCFAVSQVIKKGLHLLNIQAPERM